MRSPFDIRRLFRRPIVSAQAENASIYWQLSLHKVSISRKALRCRKMTDNGRKSKSYEKLQAHIFRSRSLGGLV